MRGHRAVDGVVQLVEGGWADGLDGGTRHFEGVLGIAEGCGGLVRVAEMEGGRRNGGVGPEVHRQRFCERPRPCFRWLVE